MIQLIVSIYMADITTLRPVIKKKPAEITGVHAEFTFDNNNTFISNITYMQCIDIHC